MPLDYLDEFALEEITTLGELYKLLQTWLTSGKVTEEEAANFYEKYGSKIDPYTVYDVSEESKNRILSSTSNQDLMAKLAESGLPEDVALNIYKFNIAQPDWAIKTGFKSAQAKQLTAQRESQAAQTQREGELLDAENQIITNPVLQREMAGIANQYPLDQLRQDYITKGDTGYLQILNNLVTTAEAKSVAEGQRGEALLRGMPQIRKQEWQRPSIPEPQPIAEEYLKGTGLAAGTRLRSFVESQIPDIYSSSQAARQAWWERMNPLPEQEPGFEEEQQRLTDEAKYWSGVVGSAPSSEIAGGTYYGPGGLKAIAEKAFAKAQANLAGLKRENFPTGGQRPIRPEEDPFAKAMREYSYRTKYYRQPGTGLVSRLTPSVRY